MAARTGLESGQRVDSYEIVRELGAGASGSVYEAKHAFLGRRVALKCLHTHHVSRLDVRERMRREAIALSQIRHANVVTVWDAGMLDSGLVWIAMDLLDGQTLRAKLADDRPLPLTQALYVAAECADGVEAAHEVDVIHRDLKPENIFITHKNEVKVLDLGTAKFIGYGFQTTELNKVPGTVAYMSPEHIGGELVSARSDIYALGLILYEMLAGHHAFARGSNANMPNRYELGALHQFTQPRSLLEFVPGVSKQLWSIIERAISKRPEDRIQSMREFAVLLREERARVVELERSLRGAAKDEFATEWKPLDPTEIDPREPGAPQTPATTRREGTVPRPPSLRPADPTSVERRARLEVPNVREGETAPVRITPAPPPPAPGKHSERPSEAAPESEPQTVDDRPKRSAPGPVEPSVRSLRPPDGRSEGPGIRSARPPEAAARSPEPTPPPVSHEPGPGTQSFVGRLGRRSPVFLLFVGLAISAPAVVGMAVLSRFLKGRAAGVELLGDAPGQATPGSERPDHRATAVHTGASDPAAGAQVAPSPTLSLTAASATIVTSPPEATSPADVAQGPDPATPKTPRRKARPAALPGAPKATSTPEPKGTPTLPTSGL